MPYHTLNLTGLHDYIINKQSKFHQNLSIQNLHQKSLIFDLNFTNQTDLKNFFSLSNSYNCISLSSKLKLLINFLLDLAKTNEIIIYLSGLLAKYVILNWTVKSVLDEEIVENYTFLNEEDKEEHKMLKDVFKSHLSLSPYN